MVKLQSGHQKGALVICGKRDSLSRLCHYLVMACWSLPTLTSASGDGGKSSVSCFYRFAELGCSPLQLTSSQSKQLVR
jgi:hypothetical protein